MKFCAEVTQTTFMIRNSHRKRHTNRARFPKILLIQKNKNLRSWNFEGLIQMNLSIFCNSICFQVYLQNEKYLKKYIIYSWNVISIARISRNLKFRTQKRNQTILSSPEDYEKCSNKFYYLKDLLDLEVESFEAKRVKEYLAIQ